MQANATWLLPGCCSLATQELKKSWEHGINCKADESEPSSSWFLLSRQILEIVWKNINCCFIIVKWHCCFQTSSKKGESLKKQIGTCFLQFPFENSFCLHCISRKPRDIVYSGLLKCIFCISGLAVMVHRTIACQCPLNLTRGSKWEFYFLVLQVIISPSSTTVFRQ